MEEPWRRISRRQLLASLGIAGATGSTGCLDRLRSAVDRSPLKQVSLTVKTVPADEDEASVRIARELTKNLERVGVDADVLPLAEEELLRDVLVNRDFDLYVARYPGHEDADFLRTALHSNYLEEPGWQNPFGYVNLTIDELLEEQRRVNSSDRGAVLSSLQREFVRDSPFAVVTYPDEPHAVGSDRFSGWFEANTHSKLGYLSLYPKESDENDGDDSTESSPSGIRVGAIDGRSTRNRNPLAVEFRGRSVVTNLLYDSMGHWINGRVEPWLARSWSWETDGDRPVVEIDIREGVTWHDGTPLTVEDVAFTYRFLADTSLGTREMEVPAPRFRGRTSLVDSVEPLGKGSIRLRFVPASRAVANRALTVPVLPKHVWLDRAQSTNIAGVTLREYATEALVSNNHDAIGSGPFRFARAESDEFLELRRFENHFLRTDEIGGVLEQFADRPAFDTLRFVVVPSSGAALALIEDGELDATAMPIDHVDVPEVGRSSALHLSVDTVNSFYHVGFNARHPPLDNPRFRRVVARLLDREHLATTVFGGYAEAETSPLARTQQAYSLSDEQEDSPLAFPGTDGRLDVEAARGLFSEAGYDSRNGKLLMR